MHTKTQHLLYKGIAPCLALGLGGAKELQRRGCPVCPGNAQCKLRFSTDVSGQSYAFLIYDNFLRLGLGTLGPDYRDSARAGAMRVLSHTLTDHLYLSIAQRSSMLAMLSLEPLDHQPQAITTRPSICQALAYSCTVGAGQPDRLSRQPASPSRAHPSLRRQTARTSLTEASSSALYV